MTVQTQPGVGIGVYVRKDGKMLLGLRKGGYGAGSWGAPGGKLDMYENPLECAHRETREETGIEIENVRFVGNVNDADVEHGTHYVTISYVADWKSGEVRLMEPEKFEKWAWFGESELPEPKFFPFRKFLEAGYNPFQL